MGHAKVLVQLAVSLCNPALAGGPHDEFPKYFSCSSGIRDMTEGLAVGPLAQLKGARAVVMTIWPKDMSLGFLSCSPNLLPFFLLRCHVLFNVIVVPLVGHDNCVRCFISTFFFYPAIEPSLRGNMDWAQKNIHVPAKMSSFAPVEEEKTRKAKKGINVL